MADTYTLISSVTVGAGGASSIDFTSIPATYTDLLVKTSTRSDSGAPGMVFKFNSSTTNYSYRVLTGDGASATSSSGSTGSFASVNPATATASTFSSNEIYIPNYAGSTNKSLSVDSVTENNGTTAYAEIYAALWSNTAAITSINIACGTSTQKFVQNSTFYLYGIKNS